MIECKLCGMSVYHTIKINYFKVEKILEVCPKCVDFIRMRNIERKINEEE